METITESQQQLIINSAKKTLYCEIDALNKIAAEAIGSSFFNACQAILNSKGKTIVLGMGKSGHIGRKIAATLASTGTPSFFVHPAEANHGDIGMMARQDTVILISYSGETKEILNLLPQLKRLSITSISLSGNPLSSLAKAADINLNVNVSKEACPMGLAPTSSTTATLALGDALAIALLETRGFTATDFAIFHPGGSLGKKLLLRAGDIMHKGCQLPVVTTNTTLDKVLMEITHKKLGIAIVTDDNGTMVGLFTDGDLRRVLDQHDNIKTIKISTAMTTQFHQISDNILASEALKIMKDKKITALAVTNQQNKPIGLLHMHTILEKGIT